MADIACVEENGDASEPMETSAGQPTNNNAQNNAPRMEELMEALKPVSSKWYQIGLNLKLTGEVLHSVESDLRGSAGANSDDHLELMLKTKFESGEGEALTWKLVATSLRAVSETELAEKIAQDHNVVSEGRGSPAAAASGEGGGEGEGGDGGEEDKGQQNQVPDYKTQKTEIHAALQQRLKQGETWYLVDVKWMKQWKKYVGYDQWDQSYAGQDAANPGPIDNASLFRNGTDDAVRDHLMEELDYFLLPEGAWSKLTSWYGLSQNSRPLARKVVEHGMYMKHCKVEVYLLEFKLCVHPNFNNTKPRSFSRADTVDGLEKALKEEFQIDMEAKCRVWHRFMTHTYELLSNSEQTLQDAGLYNGQTIVLEKQNEDGSWPRQTQQTSASQHPTRSSDTFTSSNNNASSGRGTSSGSGGGASGYSSSGSGGYYWGQQPSQPGLCGLSNLGNTCFMNAALQCLSNTTPLTEYFVGTKAGYKPYKKHINRDNPLGMGGAIAEAYGALLDDIWSGKASCVAPRHFKTQVGRYAPQFVGYAQHDSQELLAFLLDGLHEDLNLVREKPYVDMTVKTDDRSDKEIAEETWMKYLLRNQSVVVREFQGQLKSTLVCPHCNGLSKIFDPFMFLSLPLPIKKTRTIYVSVVKAEPGQPIVKYKLKVPKRGCILDLKKELGSSSNLPAEQLTIIDVYNSRFHRIYSDRESLSHILERDDIFAYQIYTDADPEAFVHVPVYLREAIERQVNYSYQSYSQKYHQLFGIPMVVKVRRQCTYRDLYAAIYQRYSHALSQWTETDSSENKCDEDTREAMEDDNHGNVDNGNEEISQKEREERETSEEEKMEGEREGEGEAGGGTKQGEGGQQNDGDAMETVQDLFRLSAVNAYGSQEVKKIEDEPSKVYTITNQTYIGCNWESKIKDACYNSEIAEKIEEHESCHESASDQKKNIHLRDCLRLFTEKETLSKDDAWYCPTCKDFVQASKKFDLWKLPEILVIHLKRFSYDRYWRDKLDVLVEFPVNGLDLSEYVRCPDEPQPLYDLYAISNHFGGMGGGHYTAFAKNHESGKWYNFDDSHVSQTSEDRLVTASAYVLFYRRRTEGRPVRRNILDRSLSQSFADEHKKLKEKYAASSQLEEEEEEEKGELSTDKKMEQNNEQSNRTRNESSASEEVFEGSSLEEPD